jgi:hypothetical protein
LIFNLKKRPFFCRTRSPRAASNAKLFAARIFARPTILYRIMHKLSLRLPVAALLATTLLWAACRKSDFSNAELADHTAEFAFPLFSTELQLKDLLFNILNDTLSGDTIFVNADNTMTLFYTGDVAQKPATDIFNFLQAGAFPMADSTLSNPIQAPGGVTVRIADLLSGTMGFILTNTTTDTLRGYFEVPPMSLNGVVFRSQDFTIAPSQTWNSGPLDLTGQRLASDNGILTFKYFAYKSDGTRVLVPNGFSNVFVVFLNLKFSYVEGYWGYQLYPLTRDTIEIDINQTELKGDVRVKDPKVTMRISNSWGFPTRGIIKYLSFIGQNGEEIPLNSTIFQEDANGNKFVDFDYPAFAANEIGQTKYTDITLDASNSNIADIFNAQPTRLIYEVDGVSNAELDPNLIGFLTDESTISLQLRVELVLEGSVKNFGAEQTLNLDFGEFGSLDSAGIEDVEFKLVTENSTPISTALQIYFRDEAGIYLDSLFDNGPRDILRAAPINAEGIAIGTTRTEEFVPMSADRFDRIRTAKDAFLKTAFTTAEGGQVPVKLLATDKAVVKMGIKVRKKSGS